jgi:A/G-specific adenine glycosylase
LCPWYAPCAARSRGDPEIFPIKAAKREGKLRRGAAFVVIRADGAMLLRSRPSKGLLGGMTEVPTTEWTHTFDEARALDDAPLPKLKWRRLVGTVNHTFTHFPLELDVYVARVPDSTPAPARARFVPQREVDGEALPSLMRKVIAHALSFKKPDRAG